MGHGMEVLSMLLLLSMIMDYNIAANLKSQIAPQMMTMLAVVMTPLVTPPSCMTNMRS
jgi:hypothetical protein